jgi:uncharacterized delta-60 repeat protein
MPARLSNQRPPTFARAGAAAAACAAFVIAGCGDRSQDHAASGSVTASADGSARAPRDASRPAAAAGTADDAHGSPRPRAGTVGKPFSFVAGGSSDAAAMAPTETGGWLVAGSVLRRDSQDTGVARLTAAGELDASFSGDGRVAMSVSPGYELARDVAALPGGGAIVVGCAEREPDAAHEDTCDAFVLRLLPDGRPDPSFGTEGQVLVRTGRRANSYESATQVIPLGDSRILVAGDDDRGAFLMRLLPDGQRDPEFGTDGVARPLPDGPKAFVISLQQAQRGGWLIAGSAVSSGRLVPGDKDTRNFDLLVARTDPDGHLDPSFGRGGTTSLPVAASARSPVTTSWRLRRRSALEFMWSAPPTSTRRSPCGSSQTDNLIDATAITGAGAGGAAATKPTRPSTGAAAPGSPCRPAG